MKSTIVKALCSISLLTLVVLGVGNLSLLAHSRQKKALPESMRIELSREIRELFVTSALEVHLHQGDEPYMEVRASDPETLDLFAYTHQDKRLKLSRKKKSSRLRSREIQVHLYLPNLERLSLAGASMMQSDLPIEAERFELEVSGASRLNDLIGNARQFVARISGASIVKGSMRGERADINISGASRSTLWLGAKHSLSLGMSGASRCALSGEVEMLDLEVSGASQFGVNTDMKLSARRASISGSGASRISVEVTEEVLSIDLSGATRLYLKGSAQRMGKISIRGACRLSNE
ncbi:GIN domain-containing protein [Porphyromonas sp. COT-239 OH1446]|uniref:GIN domain-containing protein n=1 Tax=Porphyromonas sp. COT-239 OH1446 TaxID=1515613 RepID=UPI00052D2337|nr:DUF2807 domain-containing protein [Porphyromonas sp. COT-239 OH1446]KGN71971.1 hypothetical protein HQ37_00955 [Porphyromonas sp. COT-239 OH1446]